VETIRAGRILRATRSKETPSKVTHHSSTGVRTHREDTLSSKTGEIRSRAMPSKATHHSSTGSNHQVSRPTQASTRTKAARQTNTKVRVTISRATITHH